jgi:hypothetical protein
MHRVGQVFDLRYLYTVPGGRDLLENSFHSETILFSEKFHTANGRAQAFQQHDFSFADRFTTQD